MSLCSTKTALVFFRDEAPFYLGQQPRLLWGRRQSVVDNRLRFLKWGALLPHVWEPSASWSRSVYTPLGLDR